MPERKQALLDALRNQSGQWLDRNALADATGKRRLSPNDVHHLEALVAEGRVEETHYPVETRNILHYRFVAVDEHKEA